MTPEEQYTLLLEKQREKELIPFFQSLTETERRSLAPLVKKLAKEYFKFEQRGSTWSQKATDKQRNMLYTSFFVCYNKKEFEKENPLWMISREQLEPLLSWYRPSWFSEYINNAGNRDWIPYNLNYDYVIELAQRGFLQPEPQLIAKTLVSVLYENRNRQNIFRPERLGQHEVTLREHIWYLFQFDTNVYFSHRYLYNDGKQVEKGWMDVFQLYVEKGKIDKQQILQEALLASNRNFNKNLSGWFAELFVKLEPSQAQTLSLQAELFNLFASPHSKVVTTALQACKTIVEEPLFDTENFLGSAPILLASSTKAVVATTLQLLEKLAKQQKDKRGFICQLATGALIHKDESLQTRAAKLIAKYGDHNDEELQGAVGMYRDTLFSGAKSLLQPFFSTEAETAEESNSLSFTPLPKGKLADETALPAIHNIDELVFLTSQAFDNNESWHIDLLPAALIDLQHKIRGEDIPKLEPAIQRALKLFFGDWRSTQGHLDYLLATFFLDYCLFLIEKFPAHSSSARSLYASFLYKSEENKRAWQEHGTNLSFLASFKAEGDKLIYGVHTKLLNTILLCLKGGQTLPMLCAPTHAPAWIDPVVLVERLYEHQVQNAPPDSTDLEVALSRCWLHGTEEAVETAKEKLTGELKQLMLFLLHPEQQPVGPFTLEAAWMTAALSKSPGTVYPQLSALSYSQKQRELYTGQYPYQVLSETYTYDKHHWVNGKTQVERATAQRNIIKLDLSAQKPKKAEESGFKKFISKITGSKKEAPTEPAPLLYDYFRIKNQWIEIEERDIRRVYMLAPNNPEPLLALTIDKCLNDPAFFGETVKRFTISVLQALHETGKPLGETGHLFLALCLTCTDKTAATYAAEIWLGNLEEKNINSSLLGRVLGKLEAIEFAPLKRFTDLVVKSLLNVSPLHNRELELLLAAMLKELPPIPVKGLKKLLEIYLEVVRLNDGIAQDEEVKAKLAQWKDNNALSKLVKAVEG